MIKKGEVFIQLLNDKNEVPNEVKTEAKPAETTAEKTDDQKTTVATEKPVAKQ